MSQLKLGIVSILRDAAKADYWGTMERVAAIGYQGVEEGYETLLTGDVAANLRRYNDLGLQIISYGTTREQLRDDLGAVIAKGQALKSPNVTVYWSECATRDAILRDTELYNAAGKTLAEAGIRLTYHNHDHEFRNRFNGLYALDLLAEYTDPAALGFEVDIAWVAFGGEDPVRVINKLAGRVAALHVKDLYGLGERGEFTAVGTGVVPITASLQAAIDTGVAWAIVEQDRLRNLTDWETATVSYLNLKEAGFA